MAALFLWADLKTDFIAKVYSWAYLVCNIMFSNMNSIFFLLVFLLWYSAWLLISYFLFIFFFILQPSFLFSQIIDFNEFEDIFRLGPAGPLASAGDGTPKTLKKNKKPETISLLEPNRLRNVGKVVVFFFSQFQKVYLFHRLRYFKTALSIILVRILALLYFGVTKETWY